ncbi:MAG: chromosomal replication initiator protein [Alphaproteobacteria bacterium]|jgi:chromosomal replication initiator protein
MSTGLQSDISFAKHTSKSLDAGSLSGMWADILSQLNQEYNDPNIKIWLDPLTPYQVDNFTIIMSAPTRFARDSIKNKFSDSILKAWQSYLPNILTLDIIVGRQKKTPIATATLAAQKETLINNVTEKRFQNSDLPLLKIAAVQQRQAPKNSTENSAVSVPKPVPVQNTSIHNKHVFDEKYTFNNFIVGPSNELAFAAARKVAEGKTVTFNPLFFHGGVGLGKTHLMHAIALYMSENSPNKSVIYLSAEQFMHRFVLALRNKDTQTFKEEFRNVDVLMIDDLQFITGKTQTQEEFFHTFNALVDSKKQVIISADRSPNDMGNMEDRIRSRLSWGLVVDIYQTDYSLRLGILKSKIELLQKEYPSFFVPDKVTEYLAHCITGNIRELEGAINRIAAHATFTGRPVTLELTEDVIADLLRMYEKKLGVHEIRKRVCSYFSITPTDLDSSRRSRDISFPRQVAMYLTKSMTGMSYPEIGRKFGGKDHTTVIHAVHKIEIAINENNDIALQIKEIRNLLKIG